jgi:hypothetical protein
MTGLRPSTFIGPVETNVKFKEGVSIKGIKPELMFGLIIADAAYKTRGVDMVVTAIMNGKHSEKSLHYKGLAADLRTKWTGLTRQLFDVTRIALEPIGFDVVLEDEGGESEHLHLEYQPKA